MTAFTLLSTLILASASASSYPPARWDSTIDTYQGSKGAVTVADPFRWMENPDSQETQAWVSAENAITRPYLAGLPGRAEIKATLERLTNYERYSIPVKVGGHYFYSKNDGLQNQAVIYVTDSLSGTARMLLDPNPLSTDGTTAVSTFDVSPNGRLMAYALQEKGTDWRRWRIRDVATGQDLPDELLWSKYGDPVAWTRDSRGFYYNRFPEPASGGDLNLNQKIYFHAVGTPQSADPLIYERPTNPEWYLTPTTSDDGRFLVVSASPKDSQTVVLVQDLLKPGSKLEALIPVPESIFGFIGSSGDALYFQTNAGGAQNSKIVAIDVSQPDPEHWRTVIAEAPEAIASASLLGQRLVISSLKDAHSVVKIYDKDGAFLRGVDFPESYVSAAGFAKASDDGETFYSYESFLTPGSIYRYELSTGTSSLFRAPHVSFDASRYETRQVFYTSKDGTKVPMFITARKDVKLDGTNRTLLYGYGGFDIALPPSFSTFTATWLERGGIYALANLRGGAEYGETWHLAGTKLSKQNVFDDFIAAAQYLIATKHTSQPRLAIRGGSNGGLLVGACLMQRPELFGAALPEVGVMDLLRFNKFSSGRFWTDDYGSPEPLPADPTHWDAREFDNLYRLSPYHSALRALRSHIAFPPTLVTTADHDDRVVPMHSFKFAAALQAAQAGPAPVLIRVETNAGHGSGMPISKRIDLTADEISFAESALER